MDKVISKFYDKILRYAGLEYKESYNSIVNINDKLGEFTLHDKDITLPFNRNLKNPNGKVIFHLLNENYVKPEVPLFNLYRKRLVCEINLKLSQLFSVLAMTACSTELQKKITNAKLLEFMSEIHDVDMVFIEHLVKVIKASKDINGEGFIIDFYIKKNGEVDGVPYSAIGKVNFPLYEEVKRAMNDTSRDYKLFDCKVRKKDINVLYVLFNTVFPDVESTDVYLEKTDNKVFRFLNVLLKTTYLVSNRINELADLLSNLKDETLSIDDIMMDISWVDVLEDVYKSTQAIRMIPGQSDISMQDDKVKHIRANEDLISDNREASVDRPVRAGSSGGAFVDQLPVSQQPQHPNTQVPQYMNQQPQQPQGPIDPNELLKNLNNRGYIPQQNMQMPQQPMYPMMQQPQMPQQQMPSWMRNEINPQQNMGYPPQNMGYPQQNMGYPQQNMGYPPQNMGYPQQNMGYPLQPQYPYQQPNMGQPSILDPRIHGKAVGRY